MKFKEELLQFIWQYKLFNNKNLRSVKGEPIEIIDVGKLNLNSGADFMHARVKIGDMILVGNIELHIKERDWLAHQHDKDKAYDNIILHVVYEADNTVQRQFETLELQPLIDQGLLHTYQMLFDNKVKIPCYFIFKKPADMGLSLWLHYLTIERLEHKIYATNECFLQCGEDWNRTTATMIAGYLGGHLNKEPFMQLMMSFDYHILAKYCKNIFRTEALLFGQSGLLEGIDLRDDYQTKLRKEYEYMRSLFKLQPLQPTAWKFSRLRPSAFPTIRIAQLAKILFVHRHLFDDLIKNFKFKDVYEILTIETSAYWKTHYHFGCKKEHSTTKTIGKSSIDVMIINAIIPLLFYYGKETDNQRICNRALEILEQLRSEQNNIIKLWESLGMTSKTAYDSQALLQLKNEYCDKHRCLQCKIGLYMMKNVQSPKS